MRFLFLNADFVANMQISLLSKCKVPCIIYNMHPNFEGISEQKKCVQTVAFYVIVLICFITLETTGILTDLCLDSMVHMGLVCLRFKNKTI